MSFMCGIFSRKLIHATKSSLKSLNHSLICTVSVSHRTWNEASVRKIIYGTRWSNFGAVKRKEKDPVQRSSGPLCTGNFWAVCKPCLPTALTRLPQPEISNLSTWTSLEQSFSPHYFPSNFQDAWKWFMWPGWCPQWGENQRSLGSLPPMGGQRPRTHRSSRLSRSRPTWGCRGTPWTPPSLSRSILASPRWSLEP